MLINSNEKNGKNRSILIAFLLLFSLLLLKIFIPSKNNASPSISIDRNQEVEMPVILDKTLFNEDLQALEKNKIYEKDNTSIYLNNNYGTPTLMLIYKGAISELQKTGRFLTFIHLKDPSAWRAINKKYDHILLTEEYLIPIQQKINGASSYIFQIKLEHPYFDIDNLRALEFVRHTKAIGRFEEMKFVKDSSHYIYPISNTLKKLQLSIKSSAFEKITNKRNIAVSSGILVTDDSDYVKAKVAADGQKTSDAEIRLKGDWTDHLEHPTKWSYRIVPKGANTIFGMRKFSVQHPKSRNYIWEWLFNKVIKDNDLVGLRYDFLNVDIKLTDKDSIIPMGIMALEESFDKILIENNRRREGLILGFDESMMWNERKKVMDMNLDYPKDVVMPKPIDLPVKVYNEGKVLSTAVLSNQFQIAQNLILGLRDGKLSLSEAFDVDKLSLYIALSNLFGGHHGLHIENIRIYYNPVTNLLEPVSFDSNSGFKINLLREYPIGVHDTKFKEKLVAAYEKVSSQEFIQDFLNTYKDDLQNLALNLSGEFNEAPIDFSVLEHNANMIKKKVFPSTTISSSFLSYEETNMNVQIKNYSEFSIVIDGLVLDNGKALNELYQQHVIAPGDTVNVNFKLKKEFNNAFVSKKNKEGGFRYPKDLIKVQLKHHILGSNAKKFNTISPINSNVDIEMISQMQLKNNLETFNFVKVNQNTKVVTFKAGNHTLNRVIYVPTNYELHIEPGFTLDFTNQASLISYAPMFSNGTKENPINFISSDNTGGGIFVTSTQKKSIVKHTNFTNLSVPNLNIWKLSGAVNFNEAVVQIKNCSFQNNRSEDALNIIRTTFEVDSTSFLNTYSDSFDGDFVTGSITNSTFINSGNDAIDVSGSRIELANIIIKNPSDKGLSAGEDSTMNGTNIKISDGEIAIVSKDLSRIDLTNITIKNTRLGMACFQKKTEFGPGIISLKDVSFNGIEVAHLIEPSSNLIIDNIAITDKSKDVIDLMYGNEYGKSSK